MSKKAFGNQVINWLGFVWDLKIGSVEIPDRKMAHFKEKLNYV
jgi:hypothetical protein